MLYIPLKFSLDVLNLYINMHMWTLTVSISNTLISVISIIVIATRTSVYISVSHKFLLLVYQVHRIYHLTEHSVHSFYPYFRKKNCPTISHECRNISHHALMGRPAARLETTVLVKQMYVLVQNVDKRRYILPNGCDL